MAKIFFNVDGMYCYECTRAVKSFLGGIKGIRNVEAEGGKMSIEYDDSVLNTDELRKMVNDTVSRLGYRIVD